MKSKFVLFITVVAFFISLCFVQGAFAQKTSVAEEILKVLHQNGQITTKQYHRLLEKAQKEHRKRARQKRHKAEHKEGVEKDMAKKKISSESFSTYWKNGLHFESSEQDFKLKLGGRILNDWAYIDGENEVEQHFENSNNFGDTDEEFGSGTEVRQGRFYLKGSLYDRLMFKAQYDFAGGDVDFKDTWMGFKDIPYAGNIKIGHFKEPFSLEELTSRKYITFMERSLAGQAGKSFVPARNTGIMLYNTALNKKMTWAFGGFRETGAYGNGFGEDEIYNLTGRVTGVAFYRDGGRKLLHLGLSYSHKFLDDNATLKFRARPEAHLTDFFVNTGDLHADNIDLLGPELATVYGPFSLQGEYWQGFVQRDHEDNPDFNGYYLAGSCFLTGESRNYSRSSGAFGRVTPHERFDLEKGQFGALEAAFRYSSIDLDDQDVHGGELQDYSAGLNWYLYSNLRMMFEYIYSDLDDVGDTNIFQSRFQLDF